MSNQNKVVNMQNGQALNPNDAVIQIDNQIAQLEQQLLQGKRAYASAYVNIALQASINLLKEGGCIDTAITSGFEFAEKGRVAALAYEKEVREKAPIDPALDATKEKLLEQRCMLQGMLDRATEAAASQIATELNPVA